MTTLAEFLRAAETLSEPDRAHVKALWRKGWFAAAVEFVEARTR